MKKAGLIVILVFFVLSACSFSSGVGSIFATETPTPTNTATETPTSTPTLTLTPTNTATSTPNATATAAVKATEAANSIVDEIASILTDKDANLPYKNGSLLWEQAEPVTINLTEPGGRFEPIGERLQADNFIFESDVTWRAEGLVICGLIFRSEANLSKGKQYSFVFLRFSGLPAWDIEFLDLGYTKSVVTGKVQFSDALDLKNGATNQFMLVANDNQFTTYINGKRQGQFTDYSSLAQKGYLAFLASEDSRTSSCTFANSWLWALKP